METLQLSYTAKSGRTSFSVDLSLTYDETMPNKAPNHGEFFDVSQVTGTYTVTQTMGHGTKTTTSMTTYPVTQVEKKHHLGNDDNKLYLDGKNTLVDRHGITFLVDESSKRPHKTEKVNLFYDRRTKSISQFSHSMTAKTSLATTATGSSATGSTTTSDAAAEAVTCYAAGTRIATARGDVAVEALVIGDRIVTASGALREMRWLGHRDVDCRRHPRRAEALPIRIAAHAFGENRPSRDLHVSPGHSICVDLMGETLIPAGALVNGTTIVQIEVAAVQYWHVELDSHDIILAENLPAESYLEMGNRGFFAESGIVALAAIPDAKVATHADFCRPFHADGPVVEAVRARLEARAAQARRAEAA